jgi:hypothetical protein
MPSFQFYKLEMPYSNQGIGLSEPNDEKHMKELLKFVADNFKRASYISILTSVEPLPYLFLLVIMVVGTAPFFS